eukprot:Transcript_18312.p2 GENE.Transcript_18312~~Transcript_18312.p2  ORF type:complete len:332 (-),score=134.91 Transcript_18312:938-1861(-)
MIGGVLHRLVATTAAPAQQQQPHPHLSKMPPIVYGTAWKKERTVELVLAAVRAGFRGIDTACQPKHYNEPAVGEAIAQLAQEGVTREQLWIQTKYTPYKGQDPDRLPYKWPAPLEQQVAESVSCSLSNLRVSCLDCLLLHSPLPTHTETMRVWRAMEKSVAQGKARTLGLSNCYDVAAFRRLYEEAEVKPSVLQNRFYERSAYDAELRAACDAHGVRYQSFWTLTANKEKLGAPPVTMAAAAHGCTREQVWMAFTMALGITPLTGTTSEAHMRDDLAAAAELRLSAAEVDEMRGLLAPSKPARKGWF